MNLLGAEQAIIDQIKAGCPSATQVVSGAVIAGSLDITEYLPIVVVQPGAGSVSDESYGGGQLVEQQDWLIAVGIKCVADRSTMGTTYAGQAGGLIGEVIKALAGWAPAPNAGAAWEPMYYTGRAEPLIEPGYAEFPLTFRTVTVLA